MELITSIGGGICGLIWLALCIWAVISIVGSAASALAKALWILLVFFFPVVGLIIWFLLGPKGA
ncbi:MAG: hypothetical protein GF320_00565 [Armatimonadia bacterium]|nr:hypothetical protein [Armatimonadia bacterium]